MRIFIVMGDKKGEQNTQKCRVVWFNDKFYKVQKNNFLYLSSMFLHHPLEIFHVRLGTELLTKSLFLSIIEYFHEIWYISCMVSNKIIDTFAEFLRS